MKLSLSSFFLLLLATVMLSSCEKCGNVTRSSPTAADAEWLPYRENDEIRFITELNDTVVYNRSGIFAQEFPGEGFSATDECIDKVNVQIRSVIGDTSDNRPSLITRILRKPDDLQVELGVADMGIWEVNDQEPPIESLQVNGKAYNNVYEVRTNSTQEDGVRRILYNKEFGFLRVEFNDGKFLQLVSS